MKKIDLFIVGAQKAATTSLLRYLAQHPRFYTHPHPEMTFFARQEYEKGYEHAMEKYFGDYTDDKKLLAKHAMLMYSEEAVKRLAEHNPDAIIVALVRDPVARAYSAYWFARSKGKEDIDTFEAAIAAEKERLATGNYVHDDVLYLTNSAYDEHISYLLKYFPRKNVYVYSTKELRHNTKEICDELRAAVGLDDGFEIDLNQKYNEKHTAKSETWAKVMTQSFQVVRKIKPLLLRFLSFKSAQKVKNFLIQSNKKKADFPAINPATYEQLKKQFEPTIERLNEVYGKEFDLWK